MIWTWTQPVRPSCVQFSLLVNQASFTEAPAARSKESAVCRENQLFIIYHLKDQHLLLIDQYCQDSPPISESPQSSTRSPSPKCCQLQSQPVIEIGNSRKMRIFSPCLKSAWTWRMPHLFCRTEIGHLTHAELNPAPRSLPGEQWLHTRKQHHFTANRTTTTTTTTLPPGPSLHILLKNDDIDTKEWKSNIDFHFF